MAKRKLSDLDGSEQADKGKSRKMSMKAFRITNKFDLSVQMIIKGLKTARGFERQKLSRREKAARSPYDSVALERLAGEVDALKKLNYQTTAERYLFKQLSKTKRIAESPIFQEFLEGKNISTEGPKSTAEANILARLFKSNPVKNVVPTILAEIRTLLGITELPAGKEKGAKKDAPKKEQTEKPTRKQKEVSISESESGEDDAPDAMDISGDESGSEDFSAFDSRLAPGTDEEDSEGEEDEDERDANDISDSVSRSPSPDFSEEEDEEEEEESSPPPKKTKASKASAAPAQTTTFLPSLMMGGYWSGSEEEATDDEAAAAPKRKNRMGQQARRALWEKKYGEKANHVKAEQQMQKHNRDHGWDTKRGATGSGGRGGRGGFGGSERPMNRHERRAAGITGGERKPAHKDNEGPLHPSWEAKKKQKEQPAVTFQGKKVTFD